MALFAHPPHFLCKQCRGAGNLSTRREIPRRFGTIRYDLCGRVCDELERSPERIHKLGLGCDWGAWQECRSGIAGRRVIPLTDLSDGRLAAAAGDRAIIGRSFKSQQIGAESISHAAETFEPVVTNQMHWSVPDRPGAVLEIKRVLKPGAFDRDGGWLSASEGSEWPARVSSNWF